MSTIDYKAYATREAAALLAEHDTWDRTDINLVDLLAAAWLQGAIYGCHASLADAEIAYQKVRAEL